jgi:hypothetical protein
MEQSLNNVVSGKTQNLLIKGAFWVGGFFAAKYLIDRFAKNSASDNAFDDENILLANQIYQAGHTWGGMAEDEERIIELAGYIKDYPKVSQAYRTKYGVNLDIELTRWLNADELQQFKARLGTTVTPSGGSGGTNPIPPTTGTLKLGQSAYFTESNWNVRSNISPYKPIGKSASGQFAGYVVQLPKVLTAQNLDGKTVRDNFVLLRTSGLNPKTYYVSNSCLR